MSTSSGQQIYYSIKKEGVNPLESYVRTGPNPIPIATKNMNSNIEKYPPYFTRN